jgi:hypothetical protein
VVLEIWLLRRLNAKLGDMIQAKGHSPFGYQTLFVVLWFTGEIGGFVLGIVLTYVLDPMADEPNWLLAVFVALFGLLVGASTPFLIAALLPDRGNPDGREKESAWHDPDYGKHFRQSDGDGRDDITNDPKEWPRREDERYSED